MHKDLIIGRQLPDTFTASAWTRKNFNRYEMPFKLTRLFIAWSAHYMLTALNHSSLPVLWLMRVPRVWKVKSSNPKGRPNLTQHTALQMVRHRFNIYAGSCVSLALLTRYILWRNTASIMKGLVWKIRKKSSTLFL